MLMEKLKRSKKEIVLLQDSLIEWQEKGYINEAQKEVLESSLEPTTFNWKDIAFSSFFFAVASMVIAVVALFADQWLMRALNQLVETPDGFKSLSLAVLAGVLYFLGWRRKQKQPGNLYSNETFFALGAFATALSIGYLGTAIGDSYGLIPRMLALAAAIYFALALFLRSQLVWIFGILALAGLFGSATAVSSDWRPYYRGMNFPLRFVIFGALLTASSFALSISPKTKDFFKITQNIGVTCFLFCLWLMSIFGNMASYDVWEEVAQTNFLGWSFILMVASLLIAWWGYRQERLTIRDLGISFFVINLYTRYIEYCWSLLPKALFFALMALSFWLIGKQAERIWKLGKRLF